MSAFRAALRISRRDALRFKGRTALIMVMIGLPVLAITGVLTAAATTGITPQEKLDSLLGSADARLFTLAYRTSVEQGYSGEGHMQPPSQSPSRPWTPAEINTLLEGRLLRWQSSVAEVRRADGYDRFDVLEVDLRDPMTRGMRVLEEGRFAAVPGEIAITAALLDEGMRVGDTIKVTRQDRPMRVVGVVRNPNRPGHPELVGLPESVLGHHNDGNSSGWLADTPRPVQRADVQRLNQAGLAVSSRAVIENPTSAEFAIAEGRDDGVRGLVSIGIAIVLIVMETALLAGPAFAVGLRRRRRELAVIAAQGASGGQLKAIVLADGLVLGGTAALIGATLGVGAGLLAESVAVRWLDWTHGPVEIPWGQVLGVAVLGVVSGLTAALVPAVQASRQSPVQVLAGRAAVDTHERAGRPLLGLALVVLGLGASFVAVRHGVLSVAASAAILVLGLVALMPRLVRATGRLARWLPLPLRLSVRDASRHRVRTSSAAAAVMAATMAAVTVGIAVSSTYAEREANRYPLAPVGTLSISGWDMDDRQWANIRAAIGRKLPDVSLVPGWEAVDAQGVSMRLAIAWNPESCEDKKECAPPHNFLRTVPIGDERLLALLQGRHDPQAAAALAAGKAVAFGGDAVRGGMIELETVKWRGGSTTGPAETFKVPAVVSSGAEPEQRGALIPASAVTAAGFKVVERTVYASHVPADEERLRRDLAAVHGAVSVDMEMRFDEELASLLLVLLCGALVLVFGGTFAATGLAAADMRQDLDTMSAVGGPPRVRRLVVAAQAAYISGLGALVGVVGGAVSGIALTWPLTRMNDRVPGEAFYDPGPTTISIPWLFMAGVAIGLPLLAALVAGAFTRTRLALARRVA